MCVQITLLAPIPAAKQHILTYYMQRDGIVKSVEELIGGFKSTDIVSLQAACNEGSRNRQYYLKDSYFLVPKYR
jgi:hypothetical protein